MPRASLLLALLTAGLLPAAAETPPAPAPENALIASDKAYRAKRSAALGAQWLEVRLPFETPAQFLARLLDTAREGDSRALASLGLEFQQRGDRDRARQWLTRAAEKDNPYAAYALGLLDHEFPPASPPTVDWLRRAAETGLPEANFELGLRAQQGKGGPPDLVQARRWYAVAAEKGYIPAACNLATLEVQGLGGPVDLAAAEEHFRIAAEQDFPQGHFGLGEVRRRQNRIADCLPHYEKASVAGVFEADFWLGCFALQPPEGQTRNETRAATHFLRAAAGGHFMARVIAADLHRRGTGTPPDPEAATRVEPELDKLSDPQTLAVVGALFLEAKLVARDLPRALRYFRRAANFGHSAAQRWAGTILASGEAGERDLEEAYQWLWLAARNGQTDAEPAFQAVIKAMTGEQIIQAARRAEAFHPQQP